MDLKTIPKYDLPDFDAATLAFGPNESAYLTREQLGDWYDMNARSPYHDASDGLFFKGGSTEEYGLHVKAGLDEEKVRKTIHALMRSWAPKHEIKRATVAVAFANWFDYRKP